MSKSLSRTIATTTKTATATTTRQQKRWDDGTARRSHTARRRICFALLLSVEKNHTGEPTWSAAAPTCTRTLPLPLDSSTVTSVMRLVITRAAGTTTFQRVATTAPTTRTHTHAHSMHAAHAQREWSPQQPQSKHKLAIKTRVGHQNTSWPSKHKLAIKTRVGHQNTAR